MERSYEYVKAVADHHSVSHAAEALYISASALSKYIKTLESTLGVVLFDRIGKRMEPTYAAVRFMAWQEQLELVRREMDSEMKDLASLNSGKIRFGVMSSSIAPIVEHVIPSFYQRYPHIQLNVEEGTNEWLHWEVKAGTLDFAIVSGRDISPIFGTRKLAKNYNICITQVGHPLAVSAVRSSSLPYPKIDIRDFAGEPFIAGPESQDELLSYRSFFQAYGFSPKILCRLKTYRSIAAIVSSGLGVAIVPSYLVDPKCMGSEIPLNRFIYRDDYAMDDILIIHKKGHYLSKAVNFVMDLCVSAYS